MAVRFGLLGTGSWAKRTHGAALSASADVDFAGVWGRDAGRTKDAAHHLGVRPFDDLDDLLSEVDAVAMAVPPSVQPDLAVRAAAAGCHLLVEKPLADSAAGARRIATAVRDAGVAALVLFTARFQPERRAWLREARARSGWHSAAATWMASLYPPDAEPDDTDWRRTKGALWDVGPHALSVTMGLLGDVTRVAAGTGLGDTRHLLLNHAGGTSSTVTLSLTVPEAAAGIRFTAYGEHGTETLPATRAPSAVSAGAAVADLCELIRTGRTDHECDVRFGLRVAEVLDAAEEALARGCTVPVPTTEPGA